MADLERRTIFRYYFPGYTRRSPVMRGMNILLTLIAHVSIESCWSPWAGCPKTVTNPPLH